jgi:hypothetical protein
MMVLAQEIGTVVSSRLGYFSRQRKQGLPYSFVPNLSMSRSLMASYCTRTDLHFLGDLRGSEFHTKQADHFFFFFVQHHFII